MRVLEELAGGTMGARRGARRQKKSNRRVLNIGGNSPYLEYLPNMLKKVENYKHILKESKTPKML